MASNPTRVLGCLAAVAAILLVPAIAFASDSGFAPDRLRMDFFAPMALLTCAPFGVGGLVSAAVCVRRPSDGWRARCASFGWTNIALAIAFAAAAGRLLPIAMAALGVGLADLVTRAITRSWQVR